MTQVLRLGFHSVQMTDSYYHWRGCSLLKNMYIDLDKLGVVSNLDNAYEYIERASSVRIVLR